MKGIALILVVFLAVFIGGCSNTGTDPVETLGSEAETVAETESASASSGINEKISAEAAKAMMASGEAYMLIDVRTEAEYLEGHIEGATLLPLDSLETLAAEKIPAKDTKLLLYCRSGNRSGTAAKLLESLGYTQIYDFGGIIDWPYDIVKP